MRDLIVYGLGELGQLYGAAALRAGLRVTPITRASDPDAVLRGVASGVPLLVAVSEAELDEVLAGLPEGRRPDVVLLQNELFPSDFARQRIAPTVLIVWLLKKRGTPLRVARPSFVHGRHAPLVLELHRALDLPAEVVLSERALRQAIADKYAFILTINALGVLRDRTLGLWLQEDPRRVEALAEESTQLASALVESEIDRAACASAIAEAMHALSSMTPRGRSAEARVTRALARAGQLELSLPELEAVLRTTRSS